MCACVCVCEQAGGLQIYSSSQTAPVSHQSLIHTHTERERSSPVIVLTDPGCMSLVRDTRGSKAKQIFCQIYRRSKVGGSAVKMFSRATRPCSLQRPMGLEQRVLTPNRSVAAFTIWIYCQNGYKGCSQNGKYMLGFISMGVLYVNIMIMSWCLH